MTREEAIRRIKAWNLDSDDMEVLAVVIPELAESEDERIRKALLEYFGKQCDTATYNGIYCYEIYAWLEKQKEQKPVERSREDNYIIGFVYALLNQIEWKDNWAMSKEECLRRLNNYHPQKPAEWSEDWREEDIQTRFAFYTYKNEEDDGVLYLSNVFVEEASRNHGFGTKILAAAEKVAETIGATTICLKVKQNSPANAWYRKNGYGYVAFEDGYDWLEKNLEYMKPNKQEWSEEDKVMLKWIEDILLIADSDLNDKLNGKVSPITDSAYSSMRLCIAKCLSWLKSLKPSWRPSAQELGALKTAVSVLTEERTFPKAAEQIQKIIDVFDGKELRKDWKPSEEQMEALNALNLHGDLSYVGQQNQLISLYQDLKKLM